jgi:hypothetical protein
MATKSTIDEGKDDTGTVLKAGALYSVYQTEDTASGGILLYYVGQGEWLDADTEEPRDVPDGVFGRGFYEFASRQLGEVRNDLLASV